MKQKKSSFKLSSKILGHLLCYLTIFAPNAYSQTKVENSAYYTKPSAVESQQSPLLISNIAQQVTVRIFTDNSAGSGVIIKQKGNTYTVVTNHHVIENNSNKLYRIISGDGITHKAALVYTPQIGNLDVALLEFTSDRPYQVVEIVKTNQLLVGETVFAAGFPNWYQPDSLEISSTLAWGSRAFQLTVGSVEMLTSRTLSQGYQLGYTNDIKSGMSGGPILNSKGQLIGINGRSKYPIAGIGAFRFIDGSRPSIEQFKKMESLSWGIPASRISN
ncbi:MAG: serine protease [Trichodesmium sp. St16_bin4-tuft]|nr:serine protease [Trichodesmium sp. MAG_R01]MDE5074076.1 serine protease [Trichodesmium sp. St5_bin8]MDE5079292.1 serine protease [Trichodesmium sp. St2_bin6]MDE5100438.1 serine protease [Trichodesmium sp. St16_bin4-tuft]MDE5101544.1 serine protease [Trichodesmium sp. St19_bin2]